MSVSDTVDRHAAQFAGLYPSPATTEVEEYLLEQVSLPDDDVDRVEEELYGGVAQYFAGQTDEDILDMYEPVTLTDLEAAENRGVLPTYISDFLAIAVDAACADFDIPEEYSEQLDVSYSPWVPGARFDWKDDTVHIGRPPEDTTFDDVIGVIYHELTHVQQYQQKQETGGMGDIAFTVEDEADAHAVHIRHSSTITDEADQQQFLDDVADSYPDGTELRKRVEQQMYE
jgi:hypothetical protein